MSDWIDELAEALGVEALSSAETDRLLRVARDVAHRVERKDTPLAAFLLGMHVARRTASGTARGVGPRRGDRDRRRAPSSRARTSRSAEHAVPGRLVR